MSEWSQETMQNRGRCMAHEMHKNIRDAYSYEHASKNAKKDKPKNDGQSYENLMRSMGLS